MTGTIAILIANIMPLQTPAWKMEFSKENRTCNHTWKNKDLFK